MTDEGKPLRFKRYHALPIMALILVISMLAFMASPDGVLISTVKADWGESSVYDAEIVSIKFYNMAGSNVMQINAGENSDNITVGTIIDRIRVTTNIPKYLEDMLPTGYGLIPTDYWVKVLANITSPSSVFTDFGEGEYIDFSDKGDYLEVYYDFDDLSYEFASTGDYQFSLMWAFLLE